FHELLSRFVRTLSGGQKRRVEIAQGILHEPEVLFLDEPTTGLDPQNRANLWRHIKKLRDNGRSEEHTSELQSRFDLVFRLLLPLALPLLLFSYTTLFRSISMNCYRALFVHCPVGKNVGWRLLKEFYMNLRCYFLMSRQQGLIHKIELIYGDILKNYETMA